MSIKNVLILLLCFWASFTVGQNDQQTWIEYSHYSIIMEQERKITISLPDDYHTSNEAYHVLYAFDAHWTQLRDMIISSCRYMEDAEEIYPLIIVGVEHIHRGIELTPERINTAPRDYHGGAKNFLTYLSDELIPYIDENYRTLPYRIAVGHSLGGLFVTHTFIEQNDLFQGLIAISPAYTYDKQQIIPKLEAFIDKKKDFKQHLYFSMGDGGRTDPSFKVGSDIVDSMLQTKQFEHFRWTYDFQPGKNHNTTPLESITNGLLFIYKEWMFSDSIVNGLYYDGSLDPITELTKHYSQLSDRVGYTVQADVDEMNVLGYEYLSKNKVEKALELFDMAIAAHPEDANIYDSKGEALEQAEKYKEALEYYDIAMKKSEAIKGEEEQKSFQQIVLEHIARVKEKMED